MDDCCKKDSAELERLSCLANELRVLADVTRLQIVCLLKQGERCVCEIYKPLDLPQNLISHHLKALREAGLVLARKDGKWVHYRLNPKKAGELTSILESLFKGSSRRGKRLEPNGKCKSLKTDATEAVANLKSATPR